MKVKTYHGYASLPDDVKAIEEPPYSKWDMNGYLVIWWPNGEIQVERDGGEPEDQLFYRDWKWVAPAIQRAADGH